MSSLEAFAKKLGETENDIYFKKLAVWELKKEIKELKEQKRKYLNALQDFCSN